MCSTFREVAIYEGHRHDGQKASDFHKQTHVNHETRLKAEQIDGKCGRTDSQLEE